jgi:hypothetical protein
MKARPASHAEFWQNFAATCHYRAGNLAEIRIHPVDQGFGRPVLAR